MTKKKPDIFLGITMGMLVLAALLCVVILIVQKQTDSKPSVNPTNVVVNSDTNAPVVSDESGSTTDKPASRLSRSSPQTSRPSTRLP